MYIYIININIHQSFTCVLNVAETAMLRLLGRAGRSFQFYGFANVFSKTQTLHVQEWVEILNFARH